MWGKPSTAVYDFECHTQFENRCSTPSAERMWGQENSVKNQTNEGRESVLLCPFSVAPSPALIRIVPPLVDLKKTLLIMTTFAEKH